MFQCFSTTEIHINFPITDATVKQSKKDWERGKKDQGRG